MTQLPQPAGVIGTCTPSTRSAVVSSRSEVAGGGVVEPLETTIPIRARASAPALVPRRSAFTAVVTTRAGPPLMGLLAHRLPAGCLAVVARPDPDRQRRWR